MTAHHVAVVGGSMAGLATVEALRAAGYDADITVVSAEAHMPYDRPPLSKQLLAADGPWEPARTRLRQDDAIAELGVEWRLGVSARSLDLSQRTITLSDDATPLRFDDLVIATGSRARSLPGSDGLAGVHTLRTLDDSVALLEGLRRRPRVAIIGAGFIGAEVAAAARAHGLEVTIIERQPVPLSEKLGALVGAAAASLHARNGVALITGAGVAGLEETGGHVTGVQLDDGRHVPADLVLVGIGGLPNAEWVSDELTVRDGIVCDAYCQAAPGVFAAGDVARWHNPLFDREMRIEHLTNAREQAATVAHNLLAPGPARRAYRPVPYFWSDQYGSRLQFFGHTEPTDRVELVHGAWDQGSFVAIYERDGIVVGAFGLNAARHLMPYRAAIQQRTPPPVLTAGS